MKEYIEVKAIGKMISTLSKSELREFRGNLNTSKELELFDYFIRVNNSQDLNLSKYKIELKSLNKKGS